MIAKYRPPTDRISLNRTKMPTVIAKASNASART
jgi:hypothetical protein